jgi:CRISPR-associated protein Cst2
VSSRAARARGGWHGAFGRQATVNWTASTWRVTRRRRARWKGGAKQTLHLTDTAPSALVLAVCKTGNQPFLRLFGEGDAGSTVFRDDVLEEALDVFEDDLVSDVFIGWAKGFLDAERKKLDALIANPDRLHGRKVRVGHPREMADAFAKAIESPENAAWFD